MRLVARDPRDALHEIEDRCRRMPLFGQHHVDDLRRLGPGEAALAQEAVAIFIVPSDDPFPRGLDAIDERHGRRLRELDQRWLGFEGEARGGIFGMPDGDFLEIFRAPDIPVLAYSAKVKAGDAKRPGANFRVPAVKPPEKDVGRAIGQLAGFDRVKVIDEEHKNISVRRIKRRRVVGDVDIGIVDSRRPVEHARIDHVTEVS